MTAVDRCTNETVLPPASLSVQGSVGSHTEENRPKFCHCFARNGLRNGLQAKYTITCFSGNGQRMRTNIDGLGTRPATVLQQFYAVVFT